MAQSPPWGPPDPHTRVGPTGGRTVQAVAPRGGDRAGPCPGLSAAPSRPPSCPGTGQAIQRRWRAAALFALPTVAVVAGLVWAAQHDRATLVDWSVDSGTLRALCVAGLAWALFCYMAAADAALASWPARVGRRGARVAGTFLVVTVGVAALLPGTVFALVTVRQDTLLDTVFAGSGDVQVAQPSPLADLGITTTIGTDHHGVGDRAPRSASTTTPTTVPPTTVPTTPPLAPGRWNIALLGGDAGPNRWGLRTDTMIVVSVDRQTGDLASISVPRNLQHLPMPPGPLRDRFPGGFDDLANALFTYVSGHPELGLDPAQAVKGGLAELLGIPIDNYVLVDMVGFMRIIDALGGVTVNLSTNVHLVPNIDGQTKEAPSVGPGPVTMNGPMALVVRALAGEGLGLLADEAPALPAGRRRRRDVTDGPGRQLPGLGVRHRRRVPIRHPPREAWATSYASSASSTCPVPGRSCSCRR